MKRLLPLSFLITFTFQFFGQSSIVKNIGSMTDMGKENFSPHIQLDTLSNKKTIIGLGPLGKMQGEITVIDGKPLGVKVNALGKAIVSNNWKVEAPFFVYANVKKWRAIPLEITVRNIQELQKIIEEIATKYQFDGSEPFPFKIVGTFPSLTTHVVLPRSPEVEGFQSGKKQADYHLSNQVGELVGFYSQNHQGVFTSKNSWVHIHFVGSDLTTMGHLDEIETEKAIFTLMLPQQKKK